MRALTAMGLVHEEIAIVIGISEPTLRKHFRRELDVGAIEANAKVAQSLFKQATDPNKPNTIAGIFWMKSRAGWRDHDPKEAEVGKKIQRQEAANKMKNRFNPSAPPKLAVVK